MGDIDTEKSIRVVKEFPRNSKQIRPPYNPKSDDSLETQLEFHDDSGLSREFDSALFEFQTPKKAHQTVKHNKVSSEQELMNETWREILKHDDDSEQNDAFATNIWEMASKQDKESFLSLVDKVHGEPQTLPPLDDDAANATDSIRRRLAATDYGITMSPLTATMLA